MKNTQKKFLSAVLAASSVAGVVAPAVTAFAATTTAELDTLVANAKVNFYSWNVAYGAIVNSSLTQAEKDAYLGKIAPLEATLKTDKIKTILSKIDEFYNTQNVSVYDEIVYKLIPEVPVKEDREYLASELSVYGQPFYEKNQPDYPKATDAIIAVDTALQAGDIAKAQSLVADAEAAIAKVTHVANNTYLKAALAEVQGRLQKAAEALNIKVNSITAITHNTAKLVFNQGVESVDAFNFDVDGGNSVIKAELLADKVTVNLTFANSFVDGATYQVTATGIKKAGTTTEVADLTGTFDYNLAGIASISLTKNTFVIGENVKDYVVVKDKNGYEVSKADYSIDKVETSNGTVVDGETGAILAEGTSNVRFTLSYHDEETIISSFIRVDVNVAANGSIVGFELTSTDPNTKENSVKAPTTALKLTVGTDDAGKYLNVYIKDSNGDATSAPLDLTTEGDYKVISRTTGILTVEQDETGVLVTPISAGTGTIEIKNPSTGWKQTVTVTVRPQPKYTDLVLGVSGTVKLSDNDANSTEGGVEGVNLKSTTIKWIDQNGDKKLITGTLSDASKDKEQIVNDAIKEGDKLVVSTTSTAFTLAVDPADGSLKILAVKDSSISSATVKVSYYAAATDLTAKTTKTFTVSVANVNETAPAYDYEVSVSNTKLLTSNDSATSYDDTQSVFTVYSIDKNKNKLDDVTANVTLSFAKGTPVELQNWFDITTTANKVVYGDDPFIPGLYNPKGGTINIEYTVNSDSDANGSVTLTYADKTGIPYKAEVSTTPLLIDFNRLGADVTSITVNELLFGTINANELVLDDLADDDVTTDTTAVSGIAVKAGADGYFYAPAVKILDVANAVVKTGAAVYGVDTTTQVDGNLFGTEDTFDVEYSITNAKDVTNAAGTITINDGKTQGSLTLVVKSIKMTNDPRAEKLELLSAPVSINVVVTDK